MKTDDSSLDLADKLKLAMGLATMTGIMLIHYHADVVNILDIIVMDTKSNAAAASRAI